MFIHSRVKSGAIQPPVRWSERLSVFWSAKIPRYRHLDTGIPVYRGYRDVLNCPGGYRVLDTGYRIPNGYRRTDTGTS